VPSRPSPWRAARPSPPSYARVLQVKTNRRANIGSASAIASDALWAAVIFYAKRNKERKRSERWKYYLPSESASRRRGRGGEVVEARHPREKPFASDFSPAHGSGSHLTRTIGRDYVRREAGERRERHLRFEICGSFFSEEKPLSHESVLLEQF